MIGASTDGGQCLDFRQAFIEQRIDFVGKLRDQSIAGLPHPGLDLIHHGHEDGLDFPFQIGDLAYGIDSLPGQRLAAVDHLPPYGEETPIALSEGQDGVHQRPQQPSLIAGVDPFQQPGDLRHRRIELRLQAVDVLMGWRGDRLGT